MGHRHSVAIELPPDLVGTADLHVGLPHPLYLRPQHVIANGAGTAQNRITPLCRMTPITRRGGRQYLADRLGPVPVAMQIDAISQDLSLRPNSAWVKEALASFRISFARCNSLTSRSTASIAEALTRSAWSQASGRVDFKESFGIPCHVDISADDA